MTRRFAIGGPVKDPDKDVVVHRPELEIVDEWMLGEELRSTLWLYGPRQVGKTSTANLVRKGFAEKGWRCLEVDLRNLRDNNDDNPERLSVFVRKLMQKLLEGKLDTASARRLAACFEDRAPIDGLREALTHLPGMLCGARALVVLDEFDALYRDHDDLQYVLDAMDMCTPTVPIRFMVIARSPPNLLLTKVQSSKHSHITRVGLRDFPATTETIKALALGFKDEAAGAVAAAAVIAETEGVPSLTIQWLNKMSNGKSFEQVMAEARTDPAHLPLLTSPAEYLKEFGGHAAHVLTQYEVVRKGATWLSTDNEHYIDHLLASGLVKHIDEYNITVRCKFYREHFDSAWVNRHRDEVAAIKPKPKRRRRGTARVCVLNMGGTLGMVEQDGRVRSPASIEELLKFFPGLDNLAEIDEVVLSDPKDGANVGPEDWARVANDIYARRKTGRAGFVVMHGTDTMAFTASALAFAFGPDLPFPVVFTGAQARSSALHGDAQVNLMRAIQIAVEPRTPPEVLVCFQDQVLRGVTCDKQHDFRFDGFHSPSRAPVGVIGESVRLSETRGAPASERDIERWRINPYFSDRVARFGQYPGLRPEYVEAVINRDDIDGVMFESLGVGNLPNVGDYNLMRIITKLQDRNIPVVISSRYPIVAQFASQYMPATDPQNRGALLAGNLTHAAATTKFMWALGMVRHAQVTERDRVSQVKRHMSQNYVGELDIQSNMQNPDTKGDAQCHKAS